MEQSRKNLKTFSIIILALAGLTAINLVFELFFGELNNSDLISGIPNNILLITKIFVVVVSFLMLLPQLYIGIKGLKVAKNPDSSKGHIIWGIILLIITILGLVSPAIAIIKMEDVFTNISSVLSIAVDVVVLYEYVKYAKAVAKGN